MKKYKVEILIALIAFFGAIIGASIGSGIDLNLWTKENNYLKKEKIIDKRLELYEKTVRIFNKKNDAAIIQSRYDVIQTIVDLKIATLQNEINDNKTKKDEQVKNDNDIEQIVEELMKNRLDIYNITADFATVISLDAVFYGENTKKALEELVKVNPWWNADSLICNKVLTSMYDELFSDPK